MKVYIVAGYPEVMTENMFLKRGWALVKTLREADLIQFTGGRDINPAIYGEKAHPKTTNPDNERDKFEIAVYRLAVSQSIPIVGICRGAQLLNILCGGRMWQDINGHHRHHKVKDLKTNTILEASSTHHQMMQAHITKGEVLLVANESKSQSRMLSDGGTFTEITSRIAALPLSEITEDNGEVEAVFYKEFMTLCFQPHPEFLIATHLTLTDLYFHYIKTYLKQGDG